MELALDSNVFSFGASADFFDSSVSMNAGFFETGERSTNVNSTGFSSNEAVGERTPLNAASRQATAK